MKLWKNIPLPYYMKLLFVHSLCIRILQITKRKLESEQPFNQTIQSRRYQIPELQVWLQNHGWQHRHFWILTHQRHEWLGQIWRQRDRKALEHTGAKIHLTMSLSHTITAFEELSFFSLELKRRISVSVSRSSRYYKNTFSQRIVSHYFKSP